LASADGLVETVSAHRRRNYWTEWDALAVPTLLVRGGTSGELRPRTLEQMRHRNPRVEVAELDSVGHNVPLLAPQRLAAEIRAFWSRLPLDGGRDADQRQ
ncbi:MAG TPA: alpha/beta hydrolase, partial [Microthrixaceae bacterium]|nr:alpha/beta hydrolase [Microthrixaceae bacterium]